MDRLEEIHSTRPRDLAQIQTALGYTYDPHNFLFMPCVRMRFRPARSFMHDWMHIMVVQGIVNSVLFLVLERFREVSANFGYDRIHDYIQKWTWPKFPSGSNPPDVFNPKRVENFRKAAKGKETVRRTVKMQASEALAVMPILSFFTAMIVLPSASRATDAAKVLLALAAVMECLTTIPYGDVEPDDLKRVIEDFLQKLITVFGYGTMTHKFHGLLHLIDEFQTHKHLLTCWVHERKHKMIKRYANDIQNTRSYERSVMREVICHHISALQQPRAFDYTPGLVDPRPCNPSMCKYFANAVGMADDHLDAHMFEVGIASRYSKFGTCAKEDVVLLNFEGALHAGQIVHNFQIAGVALSIVDVWSPKEVNKANGYAIWNTTILPKS